MLADPEGRVLRSPGGSLDLSWLLPIPDERMRRAREVLASGDVTLDRLTLAGWFCWSSTADEQALDFLRHRAWRKSLRIWEGRGDDPVALQNQATLHRLVYLAGEGDELALHLQGAAEAYYRLCHAHGRKAFEPYLAWAHSELGHATRAAYHQGEDDVVRKLLRAYAMTGKIIFCEELQEELMRGEIDDFALLVATSMRELLPFQGVAEVPSHSLLRSSVEVLESDILPMATRLDYRLVAESRQSQRVHSLTAELCGLISHSFLKAGEMPLGRKWQHEARVWEPQVALEWKEPGGGSLDDEKGPTVVFPKLAVSASAWKPPQDRGLRWLGISSRATRVTPDSPREEWLSAVRIGGLALFPLCRYSLHRDLDTLEVSGEHLQPLGLRDNLWQAAAVSFLAFFLLALIFGVGPWLRSRPEFSTGANGLSTQERLIDEEKALLRLKRLAEVEAELLKSSHADPGRLEAIRSERKMILERMEKQKIRVGR